MNQICPENLLSKHHLSACPNFQNLLYLLVYLPSPKNLYYINLLNPVFLCFSDIAYLAKQML
nr:MAG TPA: hypothetical protein [Caudoviricetes sp.]